MSKVLTGLNLQALSFGVGFTWENRPDVDSLEFSDVEADILTRLSSCKLVLVIIPVLTDSATFSIRMYLGSDFLSDTEYYEAFLKLEYHKLLLNIKNNAYSLSYPGLVMAKKLLSENL